METLSVEKVLRRNILSNSNAAGTVMVSADFFDSNQLTEWFVCDI